MYKLILLIFASLSSSLMAASNALVVGTNAEFPPYSYIEKGEIVGFDIDVAKEVGNKLGKELQFKDMPFDALIPDIILGRVDFVAAGMSYTEERAKRVLFTKSYLSEDPLVIFSKANQPLTLDDLAGKTVIVNDGFTADTFMSSKPEVNLVRLPVQSDGFLAVKNGRADAFVTAQSTVNAFFETQNPAQFHITPIKGTGETCALVVPKSKPDLLINIQKALGDMEKDGTMARLKTKWKL